MTHLKFVAVFAFALLFAAEPATAQPGWRHPHHRYYYGYGPVYAPVVMPPPPPPTVVVTPAPVLPPGPVYVAPAPAPMYVPQPYTYGAIGPRGHAAFGYSSPGFGIYLGR